MDKPDILTYQHNYFKPTIDKAIKMTEQYIIDNGLILTGGMSIDLALRVKNKSIYTDDALADYDILSDQNLFHAHELAKLLCNAGISDVNVINAVHITTIRVRVGRDVMLDATYVPSSIFSKIPYLDTGDLKVIHPHYQFIDQRISLGMLMQDSGLSLNIFNRLEKDVQRNNLLRLEYPITTSNPKVEYSKLSIPLKYIQINPSKMRKINPKAFIYTGPACITGYAAYVIYMNIIDPKQYPITIRNECLEIDCPKNFKFSILSYDIDAVSDLLHNPKKYRQLLSTKPMSISDDRYEIIDSYGMRIGCFEREITPGINVCIASADFVLFELLRDRVFVSEEPYTLFYTKLVDIVSDKREQDSDDIWFPSVNCYGFDNLPEYKVFALERIIHKDIANELRPRNEYLKNPTCKIKRETFDAIKSHYFRIDGVEDESIKYTNARHIINEFNKLVDAERQKNQSEHDTSDTHN